MCVYGRGCVHPRGWAPAVDVHARPLRVDAPELAARSRAPGRRRGLALGGLGGGHRPGGEDALGVLPRRHARRHARCRPQGRTPVMAAVGGGSHCPGAVAAQSGLAGSARLAPAGPGQRHCRRIVGHERLPMGVLAVPPCADQPVPRAGLGDRRLAPRPPPRAPSLPGLPDGVRDPHRLLRRDRRQALLPGGSLPGPACCRGRSGRRLGRRSTWPPGPGRLSAGGQPRRRRVPVPAPAARGPAGRVPARSGRLRRGGDRRLAEVRPDDRRRRTRSSPRPSSAVRSSSVATTGRRVRSADSGRPGCRPSAATTPSPTWARRPNRRPRSSPSDSPSRIYVSGSARSAGWAGSTTASASTTTSRGEPCGAAASAAAAGRLCGHACGPWAEWLRRPLGAVGILDGTGSSPAR